MAAEPWRIALVGVGKIARDQHVPALAADPAFRLVATASRNGSVPGVPAYADLSSLLAEVEVDAVSICTPPAHRLEIVEEALAAGLHVMLEKPPATDLATVERMARSAKAADRTLYASWHSRAAGAVEPARVWAEGRRIRSLRIEWRENIRQWHPGQDWILTADGFGVFDPGINALSIATAILPEGLVLDQARLTVPRNRDAPLTAEVTYRSGATLVSMSLDFLHEGEPCWDIAIEADDGAVTLRHGGRELHVDGGVECFPDREYPRLYHRFAELIANGRSDIDAAPLRAVLEARSGATIADGPPFHW